MVAIRAANSGESLFQIPTLEVFSDHIRDYRSIKAEISFELLFIHCFKGIEVIIK